MASLQPLRTRAPGSDGVVLGWQTLLQRISADLALFGLDVVAPLACGWYNEALPQESGSRIPLSSTAGEQTFAVLVGNTRNLWEPFLAACNFSSELVSACHPLDSYVERTVDCVMQPVRVPYRCFWAHQPSEGLAGAGPHYAALQRAAQAAGLAYLDPVSHLSLHPKFGPWFALRALLVFDGIEYTGARRAPVPNPMCRQTEEYVKLAVKCASHAPIDQAADAGEAGGSSRAAGEAGAPSWAQVAAHWHKWVAVRDAPCPGHPWRYPRHQLVYHYTRSRAVLERAMRRARQQQSASPPRRPTGDKENDAAHGSH